MLIGEESLAGWSSLNEPETAIALRNRETSAAQAGAIAEAQGWVVEDGTVRLLAAPASAVQTPVCQSSAHYSSFHLNRP